MTGLPTQYSIALARPIDLPHLPAIEFAAARLLVGHAPESVLIETTSIDDLLRAQLEGLLWVAIADDQAVGFAHLEMLGAGHAHLKEIDVHPTHGRRGIGTNLVRTVCEWAEAQRCHAISLTTFRDVPWNMPFYRRCGFEIIPPTEMTESLHRIVEDETRRGLDPARRVAMWRRF